MSSPLSPEHEAALATFVAFPPEQSRDDLAAFYRSQLYPLAQAHVRASACPEVEALFLPAGGQPWSIALSLLATPARHVVFLTTPLSQASAGEAVQLAALAPSVDVQFARVREADPGSVYTEIFRAWRGLGEPRDTVVDITSGTKAMVSAASAAALLLRARQRYVSSVSLRPGFFGRESVHFLDHPLAHIGDLQRRDAEQLFNQLSFERSAVLFQGLDEEGAPDFLYRERAELARAYAAWDALRFADAATHLANILPRVQNHRGPDRLRDHAPTLREQHARLVELAAAPSTTTFLRFLVAYAARREAQGLLDAAALVHYRSIEECVQARLRDDHGIDASRPTGESYARAAERAEVPDLLATYRELHGKNSVAIEALPSPISLMAGWNVLRALGDPLTRQVSAEKLRGRVESRNHSVFAHGRATLSPNAYAAFVDIAAEVRASYAAASGVTLPSPDPAFDFVALL